MNTKNRIASVLEAPTLETSITGFETFNLSKLNLSGELDFNLPTNLRLGHLVEKVVSQCIQSSSNYRLLKENIQLIKEKQTIGEIDFIIEDSESKDILHLELAYKFYLYDPTISSEPIKNWIGPNRNDSLHQKLRKLKEKQFPLLYHSALESELNASNISQVLCFMASLFLPYRDQVELEVGYQKAVKGYYLSYGEFQKLEHSGFVYYLPTKKEWGIDPSENKNWMKYEVIKSELNESINNKRSRMVWKKGGDVYRTFFVVWW